MAAMKDSARRQLVDRREDRMVLETVTGKRSVRVGGKPSRVRTDARKPRT